MRVSKMILVSAVFLAALSLWIHGHWRLRNARLSLDQARAREGDLQEHLSTATARLEWLQGKLRHWNEQRDHALAAVATAERELSKSVPDGPWAAPPPILPQWNPESPYIWLRKDIVPLLSVPAFGEDGSVRREAAAVLDTDEISRTQLNGNLRRLLREYQQLELAGVEILDEPLPGMGQTGPTVTVRMRPLAEQGVRIKEEFEAELRRQLGDQRAELLLRTGADWLNSKFGSLGEEAKTISVGRNQDGAFRIAIKHGGSWMTVSGVKTLNDYVPPHLQPLFDELAQDGEGPVGNSTPMHLRQAPAEPLGPNPADR